MKTIKIFLASSIKEFATERISLKNFIRQMENILIDDGVFIKMFICEYADNAVADGRKQDEFSKEIDDSDIFVILAGEHLGEFTLEEYEYALNVKKQRGNGKILACFKVCEKTGQSVKDFSDNLSADAIRVDFNDTSDLKAALETVINDMIDEPVPVDIKKIRLFLTSSLRELDRDVEELGAFVCDLNDRYTPQNLYFQLNISGEEDLTGDVNDIEIKTVQDSELFYIIFHDEPQNRAKAEFDAAYSAFRAKKTPKIITYYKKLEGDSPGQSAMAFMDKLRNELGHFNSKYTHMDTVKLNIILQLKSLGLDHIEIEVKDSAIIVDGKKTLMLDNIPVLFNNKNLAALKEEYSAADRESRELFIKSRENPDDTEAYEKCMQQSVKRNNLKEAICELQKNMLKMETDFFVKANNGYITPKLIKARQLFEDGDTEGAKLLLDFKTMVDEDNRDDEIFSEIQKKKSAEVNEYLYFANIRKTEVYDPSRFEDIEQYYEQAVKNEEKYNLTERNAALEYAGYLVMQKNDYTKAAHFAEIYLRSHTNAAADSVDLAVVYLLFAKCHHKFGQYDQAEENYIKAIDIYEKLYENNLKYGWLFAMNLRCLATLYEDEKIQRYEEAEQIYLYMNEIAMNVNTDVDENTAAERYARIFGGLGNLYISMKRYKEAENLLFDAMDLHEYLSEVNPDVYEPLLCRNYAAVTKLYFVTRNYESAYNYNKKIKAMLEKLVMVNPSLYEPEYAECLKVEEILNEIYMRNLFEQFKGLGMFGENE